MVYKLYPQQPSVGTALCFTNVLDVKTHLASVGNQRMLNLESMHTATDAGVPEL